MDIAIVTKVVEKLPLHDSDGVTIDDLCLQLPKIDRFTIKRILYKLKQNLKIEWFREKEKNRYRFAKVVDHERALSIFRS